MLFREINKDPISKDKPYITHAIDGIRTEKPPFAIRTECGRIIVNPLEHQFVVAITSQPTGYFELNCAECIEERAKKTGRSRKKQNHLNG